MDQGQKLDKVEQLVRYSGLEQRRARELLESKLSAKNFINYKILEKHDVVFLRYAFSLVLVQNRLWVLVRTALTRQF